MSGYLAPLALLLLLCACVAPRERGSEDPALAPGTALLDGLQRSLPGLYGNYAQHWTSRQADNGPTDVQHWRLRVVSLRSPPGEAWFSLLQYPAHDVDEGRTLLLKFSAAAEQVLLQFAPWQQATNPHDMDTAQLVAASHFLPGCVIRLARRPDLLAGQTNPSTCRMTDSDGRVNSLVKDFALSASRIDIGDRISDPASGARLREDSIYRFTRMVQFQGWAGIRSAGSAEWQLARPLTIWSDGGTAQLLDVSGAPMGYSIRLAQVPWRTDQDTILRVDLVDKSTGETIAYAFADRSARNLGINLGWIQVGLTQILP